MSDGIIVAALTMAVLLGVGSAAFLVMRSPGFWGDMLTEIARKALPKIMEVLSKRMTPEEEAEMQKAIRRGEGDEWLRKWHRRKG